MSFRGALPTISRYTFGTGNVNDPANAEHIKVARAAMEAGVWFHTSDAYGNGGTFEVLKAAFNEAPSQRPKCIFKVDGQGADKLRAVVEKSVTETGVDRVDIAQVCGNPAPETLVPGAPLYETMVELKQKGMVGSYVLENFYGFSPNTLQSVSNDRFDGYIYYYNVINREVSSELFDALQAAHAPQLALRSIGGALATFGWSDDKEEMERELEAIYEKSGAPSRLDFRYRFPLSNPNVRTTIGATSKVAHLHELLEADRNFRPLPAETVAAIESLHRKWFALKGI
jgi:aryl-alcohol dehydrogenase-like predicted oxidoreductase